MLNVNFASSFDGDRRMSKWVSWRFASRSNRLVAAFLCCLIAVVMNALPNLRAAPQKRPDSTPSFSVASIRPSATVTLGATLGMQPGGRFDYENVTVKGLLTFGYDVRASQIIGGPGWIGTERYDVTGQSDSDANLDRYRLMVKNLLTERFGLMTHNEVKEDSVFILRVAKNGSKLTPNRSEGLQARGRAGELFATKVSLDILASLLAARLDRPVLDQTGITGEYDVKMEWDPSNEVTDALPGSKPSIFTAIQEQLGLRLESGKGPVPVVVIDSVTRPTSN